MRNRKAPIVFILAAALLSVAAISVTQINWVTQVANKPFADPRQYNFAPIAPGGSLTVGSDTITLSPYPAGMDTSGYLYISGGTGTAEAVPITATGSSTVTVTCAYTHSGAWTIQSATAGLQEAATAQPGLTIHLTNATYSLYAPVTLPSAHPGILGTDSSLLSLQYNAGNGIVVVAGGYPTRLSTFAIAPNSGVMTSGALIYNANNAATLYLDNLTVGMNGSRDAYIGVYSVTQANLVNVSGYAMYRGIALYNSAFLDRVHIWSDATTGTYLAGGAALYLNYSTGTWITSFVHDAGVFDSCILVDNASYAVNEVQMTNSYCDHWENYGIKVAGTANAVQNWRISNSKFLDDSFAGGIGISLTSAVSAFSLVGSDVSFSGTGGVVIGGSNWVNLIANQIYPESTFTGSAVLGNGSGMNHIQVFNCWLGLSRDYPSNPAAYGVNVTDSTANNVDIIGNSIRATTATYFAGTGANLNVWCNSGSTGCGSSSGGVTTQSVANPWIGTPTTTRAFGSNYQNTSSTKDLTVTVSVNITSGTSGYYAVLSDSSSSPSTQFGQFGPTNSSNVGGIWSFTFRVLPNNYYQVHQYGTGSLVTWLEEQ